ncbi:hypothetical protein AALP_AA3G191100, partial [Arabis alpina]
MKSPVIVSSNSDSGSSSEDLEVSLAIDQSHQMRVSDKGGASSSRPVRADQVNDDRCMTIVGADTADGRHADRLNVNRSLSVEESEDQELEEQALPEFVEEVDGSNLAIDRTLPRIPRAPGLSRDLFPRGSDDIVSSSSYETIERIRGNDDWSGIDIRIPLPHERPWSPPEGFLCLYECYFNHGGIWFPIPKLALEYCEARRVAPSQLTCASYRNICAILTMAAELGRSVNLAQLEEMVGIAKSGDCGRFYASMRSGCMILTGVSSRIERWKNKYFFVRINKYVIGDFTGAIHAGWSSRIVAASSDVRRRDKGIVIDDSSKKKKVGAATPKEPAEASKAVGDSEARLLEKRKDREDDRMRSGSDPKKSKKEMRKDKGLVASEVANVERPNLEERNAEELVDDQTAVGATLSFGDDYDFSLRFAGRGRHILEDPVACGEYVRCIQGHPRGPVPTSEELVERDEFLAFSVDLTRVDEQDFVFPDRFDWIPDDELVFSVSSPNRIGQYGLGEEWDSAGEEETRGDGEADPRPSRVVLKVGSSDPTVSLHGRERGDGSGSSHVSETDEDEDPLTVGDRAKASKGPSEVAGPSTKADGRPCTTADLAANPDEAAGCLGTEE